MSETIISWTNFTWNPVHGCSKISDGCRNCYAERISLKKGFTKKPWTHPNAIENVMLKPDKLHEPHRIKEPSMIFVNSMSDLFHECVPDNFIKKIFHSIYECPRHTFQILTKRPERAAKWQGPWWPNIWMGTSVENRKSLGRIDHIRECGAAVIFLSIEPLLEDLGRINLTGIDWIIVGGESGPNHRPMDHAWARSIRDQCAEAHIPFFFKQSSGYRTETGIDLLEENGGKTRIQEYPRIPFRKPTIIQQLNLL
jgi:protein gp37